MDRLPNREHKVKVKINGEETKTETTEQNEPTFKIYDWQDARKELSATEDYNRPKPKRKIPKKIVTNYRKPRPFRPVKKRGLSNRNQAYPMSIIAVISAILLGILLGIILLKVMIQEPESTETTAPVSEIPNENEQEPVNNSGQMVLPAKNFYVLQQGVYQNPDSVNQLTQTTSGPIAYVKSGDLYHVFVTVTDSIDSAKSIIDLSNFGEEEVIAKELSTNEKVLQNLTEDEKLFLESAFPFYERIVKESSKGFILKEAHQPDLTELETTYTELKQLEDFQSEQLQTLHTSLIKAYEAAVLFLTNREQANWQEAQKHLVKFISDYYSL